MTGGGFGGDARKPGMLPSQDSLPPLSAPTPLPHQNVAMALESKEDES